MKERFIQNIRYISRIFVFSVFYSVFLFFLFMFSRRFQEIDAHITGAFALVPVASVLTIFYIMLIFEYLKEKKRSKT